MPRPPGVQIIRNPRKDGSITFGLRVRTGGEDEVVPLGNSAEGWDEVRVDAARKQLLAKMELGLWIPGAHGDTADPNEEPTFRELATDWLEDRKRNPAIQPRTTELNESQLTRYLLPFFGDLLPSHITPQKIKEYRRRIHEENTQIQTAAQAERPLVDPPRVGVCGHSATSPSTRHCAHSRKSSTRPKTQPGSTATQPAGNEPASRSNADAVPARSTSTSSSACSKQPVSSTATDTRPGRWSEPKPSARYARTPDSNGRRSRSDSSSPRRPRSTFTAAARPTPTPSLSGDGER